MESFSVFSYLILGMIAMLFPIAVQLKLYGISLWKSIPLSLILTIFGTIGTILLYFFECGTFEGISFYGAVFFIPIVFSLFAKIIRIPYGKLMDLCAPAECIMLAIMKVQCLVAGCCKGRVLYVTAEGLSVRFPSQISELINALIIMIVLLVLSYKKTNRGSIYPWYMLIYGITRFILNSFRETTPVWLGLPYGSIWSICSIIIGITWLLILQKKQQKENAI